MKLTSDHIAQFLEQLAATFKEQRAYLTELDSAIGDADHGINLDRGFTAVLAKLPTMRDQGINAMLKTTGMTLVSTVGGASGPLYGTAFMRAAGAVGEQTELTAPDLILVMEAALEGIKARGRATTGEKTMIDAIDPGLYALKVAVGSSAGLVDALEATTEAMKQGMEATIPMLATKGRASYLGERSIGHQDPGATSSYLMIKTLCDVVKASAQ